MKVCSKPNSRKQGKQLAHDKVDLHKKKEKKEDLTQVYIHTFLAICRTFGFAMAFTTACQRASPMSPSPAKALTSGPLRNSEEKMYQTREAIQASIKKRKWHFPVDFLNTKPLYQPLNHFYSPSNAKIWAVVLFGFLSERDLKLRISSKNHWQIPCVACAEGGLNDVHFSAM